MAVHTTRHVLRTTFWFVDIQKQTDILKTVAVLGWGRVASAHFLSTRQFFHRLLIITPPPFGARGPGPPEYFGYNRH